MLLFFSTGCDKEDVEENTQSTNEQAVPTISTTEVTEITEASAMSGGTISNDGGSLVTARGVCWSTNQTPTVDDNVTVDGSGAGTFVSSIDNLQPNTNYFLRAYATSSAGTGYGSTMTFTTEAGSVEGTFTDPRDGQVYQTIQIGNQEWLAENLVYAPSSGDYWAHNDNAANVNTYGYLYSWETANDVCPSGWHLASDEEWKELEVELGMSEADSHQSGARGTNEGSKLAGNAGLWTNGGLENDPEFGSSGFDALPGGYRQMSGSYAPTGLFGNWWTATELNNDAAWLRNLDNTNTFVVRNIAGKFEGASVRCVRD